MKTAGKPPEDCVVDILRSVGGCHYDDVTRLLRHQTCKKIVPGTVCIGVR